MHHLTGCNNTRRGAKKTPTKREPICTAIQRSHTLRLTLLQNGKSKLGIALFSTYVRQSYEAGIKTLGWRRHYSAFTADLTALVEFQAHKFLNGNSELWRHFLCFGFFLEGSLVTSFIQMHAWIQYTVQYTVFLFRINHIFLWLSPVL